MSWGVQVLIGIDQLVNAVFGGWADETISARAWRMQEDDRFWAWMRKLIDSIFFWDQNHCYGAYRAEILNRQSPPEQR